MNKHISKLKYSLNPLDITQFRNTSDFLRAGGVSMSTLVIFDVARRQKKGLLQLWLLRALRKIFWRISRKPMRFYLLTTKDSLMGKVWGKTFDAKNPGPLLQKSPLNWNIFSLKNNPFKKEFLFLKLRRNPFNRYLNDNKLKTLTSLAFDGLRKLEIL